MFFLILKQDITATIFVIADFLCKFAIIFIYTFITTQVIDYSLLSLLF